MENEGIKVQMDWKADHNWEQYYSEEPTNYLYQCMKPHIEKVAKAEHDIVMESLEKHFKLPLTEKTFKRISICTYEDKPGERYYYLDNITKEENLVAFFKLQAPDLKIDSGYTGNSSMMFVGFDFYTPYKNSKFMSHDPNI